MVNYKNAKIYKLVCSETGKVYIGSTTQPLAKRKSQHKENKNSCSSKSFINPTIILIKKCPCEDKEELFKIERKFIEETECVNNNIPGRSKSEWILDNEEKIKEQKKQYRLDNKERRKQYDKQLYLNNKEKIKEQRKQYRLLNIDTLLERNKKYYYDNKEKINKKRNQKIGCRFCKKEFSLNNFTRHTKSKKHLENVF